MLRRSRCVSSDFPFNSAINIPVIPVHSLKY